MSTGQASSSRLASSASPLSESSTSTPIKMASFLTRRPPWLAPRGFQPRVSIGRGGVPPPLTGLALPALHEVGDLGDLLGHDDPGGRQARDLLCGRVLLALHDRPGVAKA